MKRMIVGIICSLLNAPIAFAGFAIFQVTSSVITITVDLTAAPYSAPCNGSADDTTAFNNFRLAYQGQVLPVIATIPSGRTCCINSTVAGQALNFPSGVPDVTFSGLGAGATISDVCPGSVGGFTLGTTGYTLINDPTGSALVNSVSAGATCVTIIATAGRNTAGNYVAGQWAILSAVDLEGGPAGPPTNAIWEYVHILSSNSGTGQVCFTSPLANSYLSTYPAYYTGPQIPTGGPATLYQQGPYWGYSVEYKGITFVLDPADQVHGNIHTLKLTNVTITGSNGCVIPSNNFLFYAKNTTCPGASIEVDKWNETVTYDGGAWATLLVQSANPVHNLNLIGGVAISNLVGTALNTTCDHSTLGTLGLGAISFGASASFTGNVCTISTSPTISVNPISRLNYEFSSAGVLATPWSQTITGAADNGAGFMRVTVGDSTGFQVGLIPAAIQGVGGATCINGSTHTVTAQNIGSHTFDLDVASAGCGSYTSGGVAFGQYPPQYFVPGSNYIWSGQIPYEGHFHITSLGFDATRIFIGTDLSGSSFPILPGSSVNIEADPMPLWSCAGCLGNIDTVDMSQAGAQNAPWRTYSNRIYTCAANVTTVQAANPGVPVIDINSVPANFGPAMWGAPANTPMVVNVNVADTSATGTVNWFPFASSGAFYVSMATPGTLGIIHELIDLKHAGIRTITASSTSGSQGNDVLNSFSDVTTFGTSMGPDNLAVTNNAGTCPVVTLTLQTVR
jgi:hypothetical protein